MLNSSKFIEMGRWILDIYRAFTYVLNDRRRLYKLGEIALLTVLCFIPVIGIIPLCALLGYLAEIVHNVLNDYPRPLPSWDHIGENVKKGLHVLVALLVYGAPVIIGFVLLQMFRQSIGVSLFGSITYVGVVSGLLPILFVYLLFAGAMFAIGFARYAETWERDEFYSFGKILVSMQNNAALTMQWLIAAMASHLLLLLLLPVAFVGAIMMIPVHGYLLGKFGRKLREAKLTYRRVAL